VVGSARSPSICIRQIASSQAGHAGMLSGIGLAVGASLLKQLSWKWDMASAISLVIPGICWIQMLILRCASQNYNSLTKTTISGDLVVSFFQTSTTVWLSQLKSTFCCCHRMSHVYIAIRMAYSCFHAVFMSHCLDYQQSWSHLPAQCAPHPSFSEASVNNCIVELSVYWESSITSSRPVR